MVKYFHPDAGKDSDLWLRARDEVKHLLAHKSGRKMLLGDNVDPGSFTLAQGHAAYQIDVDNRFETGWLKSAELDGWRFPVLGPGDLAGSFMVELDSEGNFIASSKGQIVDRLVNAMSRLSELGVSDDNSVELRTLQIPDIFMSFLWCAKEDDDVLILVEDVGLEFELTASKPDDFIERINDRVVSELERPA